MSNSASLQAQAAALQQQAQSLMEKASEITKMAGSTSHRQFPVGHLHTTRVRHKDTGDEMLINTEDLDPTLHLSVSDPDHRERNAAVAFPTKPVATLEAYVPPAVEGDADDDADDKKPDADKGAESKGRKRVKAE